MSRLSTLVPAFFLCLLAISAVIPAAFAEVAVNSLEATSLAPQEWSDFSISWIDNNHDGLFQLTETSGFSGVTYLPFVNFYENLEAVPVQSSQSPYTGGTALAWSFVGLMGSMEVDPSMWSYTGTGNAAQAYDYTFTYGNGDSYTGIVYATLDKGYYPGLSWAGSEGGQTGTYQITGVEPGSSDYEEKLGQVFIASYHDAATGLDYTPLEYTQGLPCGTDYLGSEEFRGGIAQVTNNNGYFYDDIHPQITDDGVIYWQGWDGHDWEIYSYTFGRSRSKQLTNNTVGDITPALKNGVLVWSQWDGNYWQIYQEVLSTGLVTQITHDNYENKNPRVSTSGQFVWMEWNGSDFEIYTFE